MFRIITPTTAPALVLQLAGLGLSINGLREVIPAWRSRAWIRVTGRIVAAQPMSSVASVAWGKGTALVWDPGVIYEYVVDGATYRSQRVSFRGHWPTAEGALRVARRFQTRKKVTVWHDPVHHDQSVLVPGPGLANFVQVGAGLLIFAAGFALNSHPLGAA